MKVLFKTCKYYKIHWIKIYERLLLKVDWKFMPKKDNGYPILFLTYLFTQCITPKQVNRVALQQ